MQGKQLGITHEIAISARENIDRQLVEAQQPRRGNLHAGLETEGWEERDDFDILNHAGRVGRVGQAVAVVGDQVAGYEARGYEEQGGLDEVDCG